jgi:signal transduction histidine kinase
LAPADLETIFVLYAQASQPAARASAGGLGVGLHLAKVVVEAHGGSIRALSDGIGRGSTFLLRLPCRAPATPTCVDEIVAVTLAGESPQRVL